MICSREPTSRLSLWNDHILPACSVLIIVERESGAVTELEFSIFLLMYDTLDLADIDKFVYLNVL